MEFITVEQFQEQPEEVQKVFLDWWQPEIGDIFQFATVDFDNDDSTIGVISGKKQIKIAEWGKGEYRIPLFTEGQLRKFIENMRGKIVEINLFCGGYSIVTAYRKCEFGNLGKDLLQAYWKVACKIANEEIKLEL